MVDEVRGPRVKRFGSIGSDTSVVDDEVEVTFGEIIMGRALVVGDAVVVGIAVVGGVAVDDVAVVVGGVVVVDVAVVVNGVVVVGDSAVVDDSPIAGKIVVADLVVVSATDEMSAFFSGKFSSSESSFSSKGLIVDCEGKVVKFDCGPELSVDTELLDSFTGVEEVVTNSLGSVLFSFEFSVDASSLTSRP